MTESFIFTTKCVGIGAVLFVMLWEYEVEVFQNMLVKVIPLFSDFCQHHDKWSNDVIKILVSKNVVCESDKKEVIKLLNIGGMGLVSVHVHVHGEKVEKN